MNWSLEKPGLSLTHCSQRSGAGLAATAPGRSMLHGGVGSEKKTHWQSSCAKAYNTLCTLLLLTTLSTGSSLLYADQDSTDMIRVEMGGYRFMPHEIRLTANRPTVLRLVNTDKTIPHNFSLKIAGNNIDIDIDVSGGESAEVSLPALPAGSYSFYCGSKMVFSESHRDKGMEGTLVVSPE